MAISKGIGQLDSRLSEWRGEEAEKDSKQLLKVKILSLIPLLTLG